MPGQNMNGKVWQIMKWIDMHCDTLSEIIRQNKELKRNDLCADLERLTQGGAYAQFFACFVNAVRYGRNRGRTDEQMVWDMAYQDVLAMLGRAAQEQNDRFKIALTSDVIQKYSWKEKAEPDILYGILTVEEGGVLRGRMERLDELYDRGVRLITLTWNYANCIGSPNSRNPAVMKEGLTEFGINLVERMNEKGMIIDVSHLSDGGFWDCIRYSSVPVAASHSNARTLCGHPRNLSDEMLHALGQKGGVIGVNFYSPFLRDTGRADLSDLVRHIRYMVNCAGEDAVALGTDFDGFERAECPAGVSGVLDVENLFFLLRRSGFTERQIGKIAGDNVKRIIKDTWRK